MMARNKDLALTFGQAVDDYERGRPGYPAAAIDWILEQTRLSGDQATVVDVGAGTGKFTRSFESRPVRLIAVEPDPVMRETLARNLPDAEVLAGRAESIPLPDATADLITFAQAWHWVDVAPASREVARVLHPAGIVALVWNIRDERVGWIRKLGQIIGSSAAEEFENTAPPVGAPLVRSAYREFEWQNALTHAELQAMITSRSYVIALSDGDRQTLLDTVDAMLSAEGVRQDDDAYVIPYVTRVTIASRG